MALLSLGLGAASKLVGGIVAGRKQRKAAESLAERERARREEIRLAGQENLSNVSGAFKSSFDQLTKVDPLDIDTTNIDQEYSDAKRNTERQFGRSFGEEIARDSARQSTADSLGRARGTGSSIADLLGFVGESENRERRTMTDIDLQSINARESRIDSAMNRLQAVGARRSDFFENKEISEYNDKLGRADRFANLSQTAGLTMADIKNQNSLDLIEGSDNIASSDAAVQNIRANNINAGFGAAGDSLISFGKAKLDLAEKAATLAGG